LKPALESKNIRFINAALLEIKPEQNTIVTNAGNFKYDYLVIATGPHFDWDEVPGMGPVVIFCYTMKGKGDCLFNPRRSMSFSTLLRFLHFLVTDYNDN
ncbi:MAG: hypothetical protein WBQ25_06020, partial [Nitrososphaeraceae archaeon]